MNNTYPMIAKTLAGLEDVLTQELIDLGASDVVPGRRMVSFYGDKEMMYKANLHLRTALRILKPIYEFEAEDIDLFYAGMSQFDWSSIMDIHTTFAIDTVVYSSTFTHSRYVGYKTKDAIADWFTARDPQGKRPSVRLSNPDIQIHVHIAEKYVTVSLDSSGESLHKRGYRKEQDTAPINEVLAAGILLKAGWKGETDLIDPFCGSGTFLIEAALIARNIAPGVYRERFAFEGWKDFDPELYERLYNDDSQEKPFEHHIYGSDISPKAIAIAQANTKRAGVQRDITLQVEAFQQSRPKSIPTLVVMNPPYGERISKFDLEQLYQTIGTTLKHNYSDCTAWIIAYKPEHFHSIGLKQSFRQELFNGSLECELRGYSLFSGSNKEFKKGLKTFASQEQEKHAPYSFQHKEKQDNRKRKPYRGKASPSKGRCDFRKQGEGDNDSESRKTFNKDFKRSSFTKHQEGKDSDFHRFGSLDKKSKFNKYPEKFEGKREKPQAPRKSRIQVFESNDNSN